MSHFQNPYLEPMRILFQFKVLSLIFISLILTTSCFHNKTQLNYHTETLKIEQLSPSSFIHTSYLETENYGKVPCNGLIVIDNQDALVFDTPSSNKVSRELIEWIQNRDCEIKGIVATHFHVDCLGGLEAFHKEGIPSYANQKTISLAAVENFSMPIHGFENGLELDVGNQKVSLNFLGEGHTIDNIVCYFPKEHVLFGGCLIKSVGSGKGNLDDANENEWSATVLRVKSKFKKAKIVIPGHGKHGGTELLDYTINKFRKDSLDEE